MDIFDTKIGLNKPIHTWFLFQYREIESSRVQMEKIVSLMHVGLDACSLV
jgi:hypothetical protein